MELAAPSDLLLIIAMALPLGAALGCVSIKDVNLREFTTIAIGITLACIVWQLATRVWGGEAIDMHIATLLPGVELAFNIDGLGALYALIASGLWVVTTLYAIGYMRGNGEANQARFYCFFAIAIFAALGIAFSANLFTLFIFYELLTLSTFPLVAHSGTEEAKQSGRVYLGILLTTSIGLFLPGLIWVHSLTGSLDFVSGGILAGHISGWQMGLLLALFVFGIGKAAVMPFHRWLPAAMVAPTPVSALLHAVAVVKAGVFSIIKVVVFIFGYENLAAANWVDWMGWIAAFTIITASIQALRQDSLKKLLAYSTIGQLSYIVLAAGMFSAAAVTGAVFHLAAHAVSKITLFFAAGAIYTAAKKKNISQLDGIAKRMPWTMAFFAIGVISMIGLPPAAGVISKFYMLQAAAETAPWVIVVLAASTLLNTAYFLPILVRAYLHDETVKPKKAHGEAPRSMLIAMGITSALTIALFIYPDLVLRVGQGVAQ